MRGNNKLRFLSFLIFCLMLSKPVFPQKSKHELEIQREKLEQEIGENLKTIEKLQMTSKSFTQEIYLLEKNIRNRQKMLESIHNELDLIDSQFREVSLQIQQIEKALNRQHKDYELLLQNLQKNYKSINLLQFIFSAESLNQAFLRFQYYKQYKEYLRSEIMRIRQTNELLSHQMLELRKIRNEQTKILERQKTEIVKMNKDKEVKNKALARAKLKEKELRKDVEKKQRSLAMIAQAIKKIIDEELASKRAKDAIRKKSNEVRSVDTNLDILYSPEDIQLAGEFKLLKGNLPWPVEKGVISESFGEHSHPVLKGIKVKNNGITILTVGGAKVKAVFDGVVTKIFKIMPDNQVVILRHGQYLTVYSELLEVKVIEGQNVRVGEILGVVNNKEEATIVHFELWNQKTPEDPIHWLKNF